MRFTMKILSLLFLLLGLSSSSYSETCPEVNELHPCTCEEDEDSGDLLVDCGSDGLTLQRLKNSLNSLAGKQNVDLGLGDFKLGALPSNMFYGIFIKRLDLSHCDLDSLTDDPNQPALLGLEDSLEELSILGSFTEDNGPTTVKLGHMRKLKELDLSFNAITELSNDWFDRGPASLEVLMISNNAIEKIGDRAFGNLIYLKELSVDGNRFGPIRRSMLPNPAEKLETLELDNNALTSIPDDLFTNMPALTRVSLQNNGILRLDQTTWQRVWQQLKIASFYGNPIECDSNLDWIFSLRKHPLVNGRCNAPHEMINTSLQDMIKSRTR